MEISGLPLDPYFAAPKMTWLRRRDGEEGVVTTVDGMSSSETTFRFSPPWRAARIVVPSDASTTDRCASGAMSMCTGSARCAPSR